MSTVIIVLALALFGLVVYRVVLEIKATDEDLDRANRLATLERACAALATLVRKEYPDRCSLAEIAETWGEGITPEQVEALRVLDGEFIEPS